VALAERFLIPPQEPGRNSFLPQGSPLDRPVHHMPGLIPGDVQQLAGTFDRLAGQKDIDDKAFHENGETPVGFSLGDLDLEDTVLLAADPGDTGMDHRLKLAGIQMSPSSSRGMIVAAVFPAALRAAEPTLRIMLKEDMNGLAFHL